MATRKTTKPRTTSDVHHGQPEEPAVGQESGILPPGTRAPDFKLNATPDQKIGPSDFRGKNLVMVFYPADWSPVCTSEVVLFNELLPELKRHNAEVLGISVDNTWCHIAFENDRHLRFPLLSDFEPKGGVSRQYGAFRLEDGTSARALFVLDGDGIIRWSYLSPVGINPGVDGVLNALEEITGQSTFESAHGSQSSDRARQAGEPDNTQQQAQQRFGRSSQDLKDKRDMEVSHGDHSSKANTQSARQ